MAPLAQSFAEPVRVPMALVLILSQINHDCRLDSTLFVIAAAVVLTGPHYVTLA